MYVTQDMYNVLMKSHRNLNVLVEILNSTTYAVLNQLQGIAISGDISFDSTSNYRRVCSSLKMAITKTSNLWPTDASSNIWFDKVIRLQVGVGFEPNILWFNQGIFTIKTGTYDYSLSEKTASFDLSDLTANIDGTLNGRLPNEIRIIAQSTTVNNAIFTTVSVLPKINISNIQVNETDALVPYDIIQQPNSTIYDLIKELSGLFMSYEYFFDENGYFIVQKIKDLLNDPVIFDFSQTPIKIITKNSATLDFGNVRNSVTVWGKQLSDGTIASWVYRNRYSRNNLTNMNLIVGMVKGDICFISDLLKSYMWNGSSWVLLNFNVVSKFNIEAIGEKIHVYSSDTIFTNDQAQLQSEYQLWLYSNFAEKISFSCAPIYYLSANQKIYVSSLQEPNIDGYYRIISSSLPMTTNGEQTINAVRLFY